MVPFSENLKRLREEKNMSRQELSKATGVSTSSLGYYETNNREPTASALMAIASVLNCSIDELLGFSPSKLGQYIQLVNQSPHCQVRVDQKADKVYVDRHFDEPDGPYTDCIEFTIKDFVALVGDAVRSYQEDPYQILQESIENEMDYYQKASEWKAILQKDYENRLHAQEKMEHDLIESISPGISSTRYTDKDREDYKKLTKSHEDDSEKT